MNENLRYRIENQYNQIDFLLKDLPEAFLLERHRPEKWSIHENLAHLASYQYNFYNRIQQILQTDNPAFARFKPSEDPVFLDWVQLEPTTLIKKAKDKRQFLATYLLQLNESQLSRTGTHPALGKMDILIWTEFFLLHESHHFYTIFWLVQEFKNKT